MENQDYFIAEKKTKKIENISEKVDQNKIIHSSISEL
jgi:hypothetical protein